MNTPLNDALKPCPFCGGAPVHKVWSDHEYNNIECAECGFDMDYNATYKEAADRWNTRANTPESSNSPASNGAAQGAMGEPAGWREFIENIATPYSEPVNSMVAYRGRDDRVAHMQDLRATARALLANTAQGKPAFTTGHCEHNNKPGGCQQHNLQCSWPKCDRKGNNHEY